MKSFSTLKGEAKTLMSGHFSDMLRIFWPLIVIGILSVFLGAQGGYHAGSAGVEYHTNYNFGGFETVLGVSGVIASLAILPNVRKLLKTGEYDANLGQNLKGDTILVGLLITVLSALVGFAIGLVIGFTIGVTIFGMIGSTAVVGTTAGIEAVPGWAAMFIFVGILSVFAIVFYFTLPLELMPYIVTEFNAGVGAPEGWDNLGAWGKATTTLKESFRLIKGHRWNMVGFSLSFIGWYILVGITLGIASLWVIPYVELSSYNWFKDRILPDSGAKPEVVRA